MMQIRRARDRGQTHISWLEGYHSFSFGEYRDPAHRGFRTLRVINEDRVSPNRGFMPHPHQDMEIITVVLEGELEHSDSMGNQGIIRAGETQRMTAGTGVTHSEVNPSPDQTLHLLQIWIFPETKGLTPGYEQKHFPLEKRRNRFCLAASRDAREGSMTIHQDASVFLAAPEKNCRLHYALQAGRGAWLQVARGAVEIAGETLKAGDGASFENETGLTLEALEDSELLLFDLA